MCIFLKPCSWTCDVFFFLPIVSSFELIYSLSVWFLLGDLTGCIRALAADSIDPWDPTGWAGVMSTLW